MDDTNSKQTTKSTIQSVQSRSPYIHWIHCNLCYEQYMKKTRQFLLLACDHVCCVGCVQNISETSINGPKTYKCPICASQTRACMLGNDMPTHLKELFHPEPYLKGLNMYRIVEFQDKHRNRFMEYLDRQSSAVQERQKEAMIIKEQAKKNYLQLEELRVERKQLEKRVKAIRHQCRELEENRQVHIVGLRKSKRSTTSDNSTRSSNSKKCSSAPNAYSSGITSFSHHSNNHSFML